jgi:hypothetical protein
VTNSPSRRPADPGRSRLGRPEQLALAIVFGIGAAARFYYLGGPIRSDEAYTFNEYASHSLYHAVSFYSFPNNHLFHTLLVHVSIGLLGNSLWALRLPALLAGLALIPATFLMARRWCDPGASVLAAAFVAASQPLISYSVDARGYSLICWLTVVLVAAADRLRTSSSTRDWVALAVLPPIGLFTIPIMLYPYLGLVAWLIIGRLSGRAPALRLDRLVVAGVASAFLTIVFYTPTIIRTGVGSIVANKFIAPLPYNEVFSALPLKLLAVWSYWNTDIPKPVALGLLAAWIWAALTKSPEEAGVRAATRVFLTLSITSVLLMAVQRVVPFERVCLFLLPIYFTAVAAGLLAAGRRLAGAGHERLQSRAASLGLPILVCLALTALVVRSGSIPKEAIPYTVVHADRIAQRLEPLIGPDDAVITEFPCEAALKYHFLVRGMSVEPLYDYRVARAHRLFVVVNSAIGQTAQSVLQYNKISARAGRSPALVEDMGGSAVYRLDVP